jgi:N6-adenosine-specific RNA methylase IME4
VKFKTIVADPPWPYSTPRAVVGNGGRGSDGGRAAQIIQADVSQHYPVMSIEAISALSVEARAEDDAHLYLWTTNSFMVEAHAIARAWGFEPKTIITWVKHKKGDDDSPSMKTGYWFRSATEHILFAVRGSLRLAVPEGIPTWFYAARLPHSVKPEESYQLIERSSFAPRLELFARRERAGWDRWGNEVESNVAIR